LDKEVKIYQSPEELAEVFAAEMVRMIRESEKKMAPFTIALSGGTTPEILFKILGEEYAGTVPWNNVHFFWSDERCVPPENNESNYGMTNRIFLSRIEIPPSNIHRVRGEADPEKEALRYSDEISGFTRTRDGLPRFDLILLGLGEDGHTASIFPGHLEFMNSDKICIVAKHPVSEQKRLSLTGKVINNADNVAFLVTGKKKENVVENLFKKNPYSLNYPAAYIVPVYGLLSWFLDKEAAGRL
jgi:6-phosphogluconolactonase